MAHWIGEEYNWENALNETWELIPSPAEDCPHLIYIATDQALEIGGHYPREVAETIARLPKLMRAARAAVSSNDCNPLRKELEDLSARLNFLSLNGK